MRCLNCNNEFEGDYCPHCGQSAATRRFTIKNALTSTLEVWGMGNRSMPRTLWHLMTRPGNMIGDYLDGKRIPFFPPVKMLFVLCLFYALLSPVIERRETQGNEDAKIETALADNKLPSGINAQDKEEMKRLKLEKIAVDVVGFVKISLDWLHSHKAVQLMCLHSFFMLFSYRIFRKSPVRPDTNLAENFYAQVYISCQLIALSIPYELIFAPKGSMTDFYPLPSEVMLVLLVWDFKQLFGFEWKATIRKTILLCILAITALCLSVAIIVSAAAIFSYNS